MPAVRSAANGRSRAGGDRTPRLASLPACRGWLENEATRRTSAAGVERSIPTHPPFGVEYSSRDGRAVGRLEGWERGPCYVLAPRFNALWAWSCAAARNAVECRST